MWLSLRTTLYHGTASEIQQVDVKLGRERKDFGKGFYMAVSKSQAIGMMHKKYSETRLFLETNEYLCEACDEELKKGADALYKFING